MGQPSSKDEMTVRHQFDRLCQMALKGEAVNYYKHMDYRRKHEVTFSELSEKELSKLFTMDEYGTENHHFEVHGYDIEVKNTLIAEALKELIPDPQKFHPEKAHGRCRARQPGFRHVLCSGRTGHKFPCC